MKQVNRQKLRSELQFMFCALHTEINRHKWVESEKRGFDVGWDFAEREWMERHFPDWKKHQWNQAVLQVSRSSDPCVTRSERLLASLTRVAFAKRGAWPRKTLNPWSTN